MLLSVIIPTCNRNNLLGICLDKLSPGFQTIAAENYEVIVTDDSKDNIARSFIQANYPWVTWVEGPKRGPAANRNNGAKNAKGSWLVFIDDDCEPDKNILLKYSQAIKIDPEILAFEGRIYVNRDKQSYLEESPVNETGNLFWSCNICIKQTLFFSLKGFDEQYPYAAMEDVDFFKRLKIKTDKYQFLIDASVLHPWRNNKNLFGIILKREKSTRYFLAKFPEERKKINSRFYIKAFLYFSKDTIQHLGKYGFKDFFYKLSCDSLQIYFAFKCLFIDIKANQHD